MVSVFESGNYKTIVGIDVLNQSKEKPNAYFAFLSENLSNGYKVSFGTSSSYTPALINEEIELSFSG